MTDIGYDVLSADDVWSAAKGRRHVSRFDRADEGPVRRRKIDDRSATNAYRLDKGVGSVRRTATGNAVAAPPSVAASDLKLASESDIIGVRGRTAISVVVVVACAVASVVVSPVYLAGVIIPLVLVSVDKHRR